MGITMDYLKDNNLDIKKCIDYGVEYALDVMAENSAELSAHTLAQLGVSDGYDVHCTHHIVKKMDDPKLIPYFGKYYVAKLSSDLSEPLPLEEEIVISDLSSVLSSKCEAGEDIVFKCLHEDVIKDSNDCYNASLHQCASERKRLQESARALITLRLTFSELGDIAQSIEKEVKQM